MENEETKTNEQEGKTPQLVTSALEASEKLKAENARMEANIKKLEDLQAFNILGGRTDGREQEQPKKEISDAEYSKMALSGNLPKE